MSKQITSWIKEDLYPSLYEHIPQALPEMDFKHTNKGWVSPLKLYGGKPKAPRRDKSIIRKNSPGFIHEWGETALSLVDYVIERDNKDFIEAVKLLADQANIQIPDFDEGDYQRYKDKQTIQEDANSYFIYCLETSPGAEDIRAYLSSRGYSDEDVKDMELGYIPSQEKLYKYLTQTRKHPRELVDEAIKLHPLIGSANNLSIPFRSGGNIKGFIFRSLSSGGDKYIASTGLSRGEGFFNLSPLKGDKDLIIVEGELDALIAEARGVDNVVALGKNRLSVEMVRDAIKKGAKSFTLCLDGDIAGKDGAVGAIDIILGEGVNRVYLVTLPEGSDPDSLITEQGVEAFRDAVAHAIPYYKAQLQTTLHKYGTIQEESGGSLSEKDKDRLLDEIVERGSKLDPMDRDQYKKLFISLQPIQELGITEESYQVTIERLTTYRENEAQAKEFKKLLSEATQLQDKGETGKAIDILDEKLKEVRLQGKATEFSSLLIPTRETDIRAILKAKPESLSSGYEIGGDPLLLPSGALSIFAAPTSHGKTSMLINLALNVAQAYKDKEMYFFSYEEDKENILLKTLNTYVGKPLNNSNNSNRRLIKSCFTTGATQYINSQVKDEFITRKDQFFKELIAPGRLSIHYTSFNSGALGDAILYLKKKANPGAIFIDYFQLLNLPGGKYKTYSRQEELKQICINLKDIAVDTGLPIILGAQFNRQVTSPMRLLPTNISEAGDIERIANLLIGFWNGNFKPAGVSDGELNEINHKGMVKKGYLWTEILKNRDGQVGLTESLSFDGNTGKISNISNTSKL